MYNSKVYTSVASLKKRLKSNSKENKIGFVPTMGALHRGHLSLVKRAFELSDIVVVSIFVNPTQFTNNQDLTNYPRTLDKDLSLLNEIGEVVVFAPNVAEVYPENFEPIRLDLNRLDKVMEGEFRPGHFNGVVSVVKRLFDIVEPDFAFFGLKDYQQLAVIKFMCRQLALKVTIIPCDIYREENGLASSSRNILLNENQKSEALIIYDSLLYIKELARVCSVQESIKKSITFFNKGNLTLEYLNIVHPETLMPLESWEEGARACIAAFCGNVRLIDNMEVF
jgi:pantoate--beta-alanine ligase